MLEVPKYNRKSYQEMFEESRAKIPTYTSEWTDFNVHDPGIMVLQLFAWLFEMQQYYADFIGTMHEEKYLRLAGYPLQEKVPSKGWIELTDAIKDFELPVGAKFEIDDNIYETTQCEKITSNVIKAVYREEGNSGNLIDITKPLLIDGNVAIKVFSQSEDSFYIGFKEKVALKNTFSIYISVEENVEGHKRPAFSKQSMQPLGQLVWEVYTYKGWRRVQRVEDDTVGLLKSGLIRFESQQEMAAIDLDGNKLPYYYFRCTLISDEYDFMPRVKKIGINYIEVTQQDTKAVDLYFDGDGKWIGRFETDHYLGAEGITQMFVKVAEGKWLLWHEWRPEEKRSFYSKTYKMNTCLSFNWSKEKIPPKGTQNIRLVCYDKAFYHKRFVGDFISAVSPTFNLEFENIYKPKIQVDVKSEVEGGIYYVPYKRVEELSEWGESDLVYEMNDNQLLFGDKRHGKLPERIHDQLVLTGFAYSKGKVTRTPAGSFCKALGTYSASWGQIKVKIAVDTTTGAAEETIEEGVSHFNTYFNEKKRLVKPEEYESYVRNTPGLLIDKVKVVSYLEAEVTSTLKNTIHVVVKPYTKEAYPILSPIYKEMILRFLEPMRLLTTEVIIEGPKYVGVCVKLEVYKKEGYAAEAVKAEIYNVCKLMIDSLTTNRSFQEAVSYTDLFKAVQQVEGILYIDVLTLSRSDIASLNVGDIDCSYNELTYLEKVSIQIK